LLSKVKFRPKNASINNTKIKQLINRLNNFEGHRLSEVYNRCQDGRQIVRILHKLNVHLRIHNIPPVVPVKRLNNHTNTHPWRH